MKDSLTQIGTSVGPDPLMASNWNISRRLCRTICWLWLGIVLALPSGLLNAQGVNGQSQFYTDVLPILERHCFECHRGDEAGGDLLLDSKLNALKGGHTGNSILGSQDAESELLLRIGSDEDGYRMPKNGPPLSEKEIETLTSWVQANAPWPEAQSIAEQPEPSQSVEDWLVEKYLLLQEPAFRYLAVVLTALVALLVLMLAYRFLSGRTAREVELKEGRRPKVSPSAKSFVAVATLFGLASVIAFQYGVIETLESRRGEPSAQNDNSITGTTGDQAPEVPKPMHPKRLGGVYYRGNDERGEELFNGGFYRTAKLTVQLVDGAGQAVDYGDQPALNQLAIDFVASRANGATKSLFSAQNLSSAYVSTSFDPAKTEPDRVMLKPIGDDEDQWGFTYPLDLKPSAENGAENGGKQNHSGTLYIFYGPLDRNRIHYAINYSIRLDDQNRIDAQSELWMGSAYDLNGRVLVPKEGELLLHHWFDFRPIPEIEGAD